MGEGLSIKDKICTWPRVHPCCSIAGSFVLWAWVHVHLRRDKLPARRVVVEFEFPEEPPSYRRFWFLIERGDAELCYSRPGFEPDLRVRARSQPFTLWHVGRLGWRQAISAGAIFVSGPRSLASALPTWNARASGVVGGG